MIKSDPKHTKLFQLREEIINLAADLGMDTDKMCISLESKRILNNQKKKNY